jgi:hypothetical protein
MASPDRTSVNEKASVSLDEEKGVATPPEREIDLANNLQAR